MNIFLFIFRIPIIILKKLQNEKFRVFSNVSVSYLSVSAQTHTHQGDEHYTLPQY